MGTTTNDNLAKSFTMAPKDSKKGAATKGKGNKQASAAAKAALKGLLNRGSVPKGKELLLARNREGRLAVWYDDGKIGAQRLGQVDDERISRGLWLNYLVGKTPVSVPARKSIIDGVMEFVERPVGTVATQVQVQTHV